MAQIEIPDSLLRDFTSGRAPAVDPLERAGRALEQTHEAMAGQIARLTAELEAARLARREEHAERGRLLGRLASLLDTLPGGVVIVDLQGRTERRRHRHGKVPMQRRWQHCYYLL